MEKRIISLRSCPKAYTHDQDKACSPQQTVERFRQRLAACNLDILREVRRIDTGRLDIPVYFSVCGSDAEAVIGTKKQMGKGSTQEQSQASACMELAERFSFFSFLQNPDNFLYGDYQHMIKAGYPVLPVEKLLFSVHDTRTPSPMLLHLLSGLPMRWSWALSLDRQREVLVPFSWFFAINEFNGPSAGNTHEEAALQGISEVVERHVCARVTHETIRTPGIDRDSVTDPVARRLLDTYSRHGIQVFLNDFSLDTGIPTVAVTAMDPASFPEKSEIVYTAGTTPDPAKALIRALTEVAQLAGDFETGSNYVASGLPKPNSLQEIDHVVRPDRMTTLDCMPQLGSADMLEELQLCAAALRKSDFEVLLIDTTHPVLQIPALYTIIPGCHFRERAAGGDAALFAAKLASQLLQGDALTAKLEQMRTVLPGAYYLDFYAGQKCYNNGDPQGALVLFDAALDKKVGQEDLPYLHAFRGACLRDQGRWQEAIDALEQGRALDDERPDLHNMLGVCFYKLGNYAEAAAHFQRAIILNPVSAIDYANLALNQHKLGNRSEALENYQIALAMDPDIEFAARNLAELVAQDFGSIP